MPDKIKDWIKSKNADLAASPELDKRMQKAGLTGREREICVLIRNGFSNQEIASGLGISPHTVKNHIRNIHQKLDVQTRAKLVALLNKQSPDAS